LPPQVSARIEVPVEGTKSLRIGMTEARDTAFGAAFGGEQMPAIERGNEILRAALDDPQPVIAETQIRDDLGVQQADGVGRHRVAKSRIELFGDGSPTDHRSSFHHLDFEPGHTEVGGASQPIVTRTDDDDVVSLH
jgi:hypothetical protein